MNWLKHSSDDTAGYLTQKESSIFQRKTSRININK